MQLLGISGSLRSGSWNSALLEAAALACPRDVQFVAWRGLAEIPPYREDVDAVPPAVVALRRAIAGADAVLIATPEFNASVPGVLKNALDWASRPFPDNCLRGKPVAVIGASTGIFGAVWAQADLRKVLKVIGAAVLDFDLIAAAHTSFTPDGRLRDPALGAALRRLVDELLGQAERRAA